jgi:uncharacterized protein YrzB (UPF0473 family)
MALTQVKEQEENYLSFYNHGETIRAFINENEEKKKTLYDILSDENNKDLITLANEHGEDVVFKQLAVIPMGEVIYCILKPISGGDYKIGEAIAFRLNELENGMQILTVVTSKKKTLSLFLTYYKMLIEATEKKDLEKEEKEEKIRLITSLSNYYKEQLARLKNFDE